MGVGQDDDALRWGGDNDPTLDVGAATPKPGEPAKPAEGTPDDVALAAADAPAGQLANTTAADGQLGSAARAGASSGDATPAEPLPAGWNAVGKGSDEITDAGAAASDSGARAPMGNATLIAFGLIGGAYVLYAIGWLIGGLRLNDTAQYLVSPVVYQVSLWLAVLAPLIWFATVFVVTAKSKAWVRFVWLVGGVALLVPWPFIMIGAIGQ